MLFSRACKELMDYMDQRGGEETWLVQMIHTIV